MGRFTPYDFFGYSPSQAQLIRVAQQELDWDCWDQVRIHRVYLHDVTSRPAWEVFEASGQVLNRFEFCVFLTWKNRQREIWKKVELSLFLSREVLITVFVWKDQSNGSAIKA